MATNYHTQLAPLGSHDDTDVSDVSDISVDEFHGPYSSVSDTDGLPERDKRQRKTNFEDTAPTTFQR